MSQKKIQWRLSNCHGYGDIVASLSYAINQYRITNQPVDLQYHWQSDISKCKPSDPETLQHRIDYLASILDTTGISISHHINSPLEYSTGYSGPQRDQPRWTLKQKVDKQLIYTNLHIDDWSAVDNDKIVVATSSDNNIPFSVLDKSKLWKDPMEGNWSTVIDYLSGYDITEVTYTTPIDQLVESLRQCSLFIGYHGSVSWIARALCKPMIIFSTREHVTKWDFPWCVNYNNVINITDIEADISQSISQLKDCSVNYNQYLSSKK